MHGHTQHEIVWTVIPVLIVFAIIAFVFVKLPDVQDVPKASAANSLNVKIDGHQYYWQYTYPGGRISIDRMVVPVGSVVTLTVNAADVIHGWWIPALGGQIDAIPGRTNHTWFEAPSKPGTYVGQCTQLCGVEHAHMTAQVDVVSEADYRRFLAAHAPAALSSRPRRTSASARSATATRVRARTARRCRDARSRPVTSRGCSGRGGRETRDACRPSGATGRRPRSRP